MKNKTTYQYPWRYNNKPQVLVDGSDYFSSMLNEIKSSQTCILFEAYLFESGKTADVFINELCQAKKRGVEVYVLLDEYGTKGLINSDKEKLTTVGIKLSLYNPVSFFHLGKSLKRDHRKLLIIDERVAFIGGAGVTDEFTPNIADTFWHDVMLQVNGDVVFDLIHSFNNIWGKQKTKSIKHDNPIKNNSKDENNKARVLISSGTEKNEIIRAIISRIRRSEEHVWLTSPYFISSWKIRRALRYAAKKGVDVRLIFPGPYSDHKWISYGIQRYYQRLLKANVAVYEFQPRFTHAKIISCDNWFTIGSSNFDLWDQFLNLDVNIEIYDKQSHQKIIQLFESNFSKSNLVILNQWNARSFVQRVKENISGFVITILRYISIKFKR